MSIDLTKFWLGLDNDFMPTYTESSYPRYNLIEKSDNGFSIEIAVPGWDKSELEVIADRKELHIKGKKEQKLEDGQKFVHQGLSLKNFERRFILNSDLQVDNVNLPAGLLTIDLSRTPDASRRKLEIS